jgi:hypothetical protein
VARLIEDTHREAEDQTRQSAAFARTEALVVESAAMAQARGAPGGGGPTWTPPWPQRNHRHDYPDQRLREAIAEGDRLMALDGGGSARSTA